MCLDIEKVKQIIVNYEKYNFAHSIYNLCWVLLV